MGYPWVSRFPWSFLDASLGVQDVCSGGATSYYFFPLLGDQWITFCKMKAPGAEGTQRRGLGWCIDKPIDVKGRQESGHKYFYAWLMMCIILSRDMQRSRFAICSHTWWCMYLFCTWKYLQIACIPFIAHVAFNFFGSTWYNSALIATPEERRWSLANRRVCRLAFCCHGEGHLEPWGVGVGCENP